MKKQMKLGQAVALGEYLKANVDSLQGMTLEQAAAKASRDLNDEYSFSNIKSTLRALGLEIKPSRPVGGVAARLEQLEARVEQLETLIRAY